ncbi:hypothetical protein [Falsirhodobacter algicola]|uniref:Heme exporter protein D n=1 Tax=Falsirhodobacter algicola TaxID=2692330 RepID=A0A8J8MRX0_9RHOB|nr:hypothetical protein [Falsirhodobacter algicola]QUS35581.1 hypothetical protein GR316_04430 [Falsirhodobacter algicola]
MTAFLNYGFPFVALALGGCGVYAAHLMSRRFDRQMERSAAERKHRHPAE